MEPIYVSTKEIHRESVEASIADEERQKEEKKENIQFLPPSGSGCI